ncbi:cupin domain-containing protein [Sphingomonas sp.]|uniref:cupin domain-containing protein n=1 Tax=Sphingomonas sp. TaxID=28214 RepID=UPI00286C1B98|nr:cupin domain-containing protein [Sphingomonas sp.]
MSNICLLVLRMSATALVATSVVSVSALATPGSGFAPSGVVSGHFGVLNINTADDKTGKWGLHLKTLDETDIATDKLTVQPGGSSGWHAHPSPVFITVTQGSITWSDGSNPLCTAHTYGVGQSFIEGAYVPHNARNASSSAVAVFFATTVKPAGFVGPPFRLDRPKPNNCP